MNSSNKFINFIFNINYWNRFLKHKKLKKVLKEYFKTEDKDLQKSFLTNFDYPEDMTIPPVRYEYSSGDVYYALNFKSKELFENKGTKEKALSNSLAILDKMLPLGVTEYLEPQKPIHIPDTFTLLCSLQLTTDINNLNILWNIFSTSIKLSLIGSILISNFLLIKYFLL